MLTPAVYDLLISLDQLPPAHAARRLGVSARRFDGWMMQSMSAALGTTLAEGLTPRQKARRLLQSASRHGIVRIMRRDDDRWWCLPDPPFEDSDAPADDRGSPMPGPDPTLPNPRRSNMRSGW